MRLYVQKDLNDPTKLKVEERTRPDKNTVCPAPCADINCIEVIDDIDELTGKKRGKKAVICPEKSAARKAELEAQELSMKQAAESEALEVQDVKSIDIDLMIESMDKAQLKKVFKYLLKRV